MPAQHPQRENIPCVHEAVGRTVGSEGCGAGRLDPGFIKFSYLLSSSNREKTTQSVYFKPAVTTVCSVAYSY